MFNLKSNLHFKAIFKGFIWALILSIILSLIITILLYFTPLSENYLPSFATLIFFLSILIGSCIAAKIAGSKGLIHGLMVSLSYFTLSIILGIVIATDPFSWLIFAKKIAYTLIGGSIGGIIGIGLSNQ